jgi:NAD(P)-dependent dehydrogenase (short-subunit alcohol dehydrogenase family)
MPAPNAGEDRAHLAAERGTIAGAQIAMAGHADNERENTARPHFAPVRSRNGLPLSRTRERAFGAPLESEPVMPIAVVTGAAGVSIAGTVAELSVEEMAWVLKVNFWGVVHGVKAFLPSLLAHGSATIVNISSVFGLWGPPGQSAYAASKFAVRGFSESLRAELRDRVLIGADAYRIDWLTRLFGPRGSRMLSDVTLRRIAVRGT